MNKMIKFVRNKQHGNKGKKIGVVVAIDKDKVGWSKCSELDTFDTVAGVSIAIATAIDPNIFGERKVPLDFVRHINEMKERSNKAKMFSN